MNPKLTIGQVKAFVAMIGDSFAEDDRGLLDAIEGETDAFEFCARLLRQMETDETLAGGIGEQITERAERKRRLLARAESARATIAAIMETAGIKTLPLPEASISFRMVPPKLSVNDAAAVPDEYTAIKRAPDMAAIKAAFTPDSDALPNWLRVDPTKPSITVRRN